MASVADPMRADRLRDAIELVEELPDRFGGLVGLHAGAGLERARRQTHVEPRACAVAVLVLLAQVLIEARGEGPAEHGIQHL